MPIVNSWEPINVPMSQCPNVPLSHSHCLTASLPRCSTVNCLSATAAATTAGISEDMFRYQRICSHIRGYYLDIRRYVQMIYYIGYQLITDDVNLFEISYLNVVSPREPINELVPS